MVEEEEDRLWMDSYGFVYSADGKRMLKGANVEGAYWIPEGVEEIEPGALIGCRIGTLHVPWTAHVHEHDQLVFSEDEAENEELMLAVYFWTKEYANRDEETWAFEDEGEYRVDEHGVAYSLPDFVDASPKMAHEFFYVEKRLDHLLLFGQE